MTDEQGEIVDHVLSTRLACYPCDFVTLNLFQGP